MPLPFYSRKRVLGIHSLRGWVDPRADLGVVKKREIFCPCRESTPNSPAVQPVTSRYTDWTNYVGTNQETCYMFLKILTWWPSIHIGPTAACFNLKKTRNFKNKTTGRTDLGCYHSLHKMHTFSFGYFPTAHQLLWLDSVEWVKVEIIMKLNLNNCEEVFVAS
jgi:hypothetical protein